MGEEDTRVSNDGYDLNFMTFSSQAEYRKFFMTQSKYR